MEKTKSVADASAKRRERGPNTRQLMHSISVMYAAIEVLREKAGIPEVEFEKLTDAKFEEMYPTEIKKEEVAV